jgi:hypothetical protein
MSYTELRNALKSFKAQGLTTIALNSKKAVLEAEYNRLMTSMVKDALATEPDYDQDYATISSNTTESEDIPLTELNQPSPIPVFAPSTGPQNSPNLVALKALIILFISAMIKVWFAVCGVFHLTSLHTFESKTKAFLQWYFSGFTPPKCV